MAIRIIEESSGDLVAYSTVSSAYQVLTRFRADVLARGLDGIRLVEEAVESPYIKDYDEEKGEGPSRWAKRWDISRWGVVAAFDDNQRIGGAVVAWRTPGVNMLDDRDDLAALWDLRVQSDYRGRGIGRQLFQSAVAWARKRGNSIFKVETQNINVPACRLYAGEGCTLAVVNLIAYKDLPGEVQLIWQHKL